MDIRLYKIILIPIAQREIFRIYDYIYNDLNAEQAAESMMKLIENKIAILKYAPKMYCLCIKYLL